jgi:hypothetical protein
MSDEAFADVSDVDLLKSQEQKQSADDLLRLLDGACDPRLQIPNLSLRAKEALAAANISACMKCLLFFLFS